MKNRLKYSVLVLVVIFLSSFSVPSMNFLPTKLKVVVLNELGNPVVGAKVSLFKSEDDYRAETNLVGEPVFTDEKGVAKFSDLKPKAYYVLAEKDKKANHGAGVKTQVLQEGKSNKVNTVIR